LGPGFFFFFTVVALSALVCVSPGVGAVQAVLFSWTASVSFSLVASKYQLNKIKIGLVAQKRFSNVLDQANH
jgi:hypothetical protein